MDDGWIFEGNFWDDIDDEETELDEIEDGFDEIEDGLSELFDYDVKVDDNEEEDIENGFSIHDIFDNNDLDIAFMLGFGETMRDGGPPRKADRHRKEDGEPIPLVNKTKKIRGGLAEEFLAEFNMKHSR